MKKILLLLTATFTIAVSQAQEWSEQQLEVWSTVENLWNSSNDLEEMLALFHEDYSGWPNELSYPTAKKDVRQYMEYHLPKREMVMHNIKPLAINVSNDLAVVHYYYNEVIEYGKEPKYESGRWTDIYKKENGKWLLFADHGGADAE